MPAWIMVFRRGLFLNITHVKWVVLIDNNIHSGSSLKIKSYQVSSILEAFVWKSDKYITSIKLSISIIVKQIKLKFEIEQTEIRKIHEIKIIL